MSCGERRQEYLDPKFVPSNQCCCCESPNAKSSTITTSGIPKPFRIENDCSVILSPSRGGQFNNFSGWQSNLF